MTTFKEAEERAHMAQYVAHLKKTGGSAFPKDHDQTEGLTVRDHFAGQAMMSNACINRNGLPHSQLAAWAYSVADAMIKERSK